MFDKIYPVKVQELFAPYLYQYKKLTLPGIGTFQLDPAINIQELKEDAWPSEAIVFQPDTRAQTDDDFLQYLVAQTGKMKILAQSDLDSYLYNGLQLLNIGKQMHLKGIGMISKSGNGNLSFVQGQPVYEKGEVPDASFVLKDRTHLPDNAGASIDFAATEKRSSRKPFVVLASLLALALLAWAIYLAIPKAERDPFFSEETETPVVATETNRVAAASNVAVAIGTDTAAVTGPVTTSPQPTDSITGYRIIVQEFVNAATANKRFAVLKGRGHNVSLLQQDSLYQIVLQVNRPLQDTAYVRDSLQRWYRLSGKLLQ